MTRPFYSEYVRHCMRFYARNTEKPRFNTEVDRDNWYACHKAIERYPDTEKAIIISVYAQHDTIADNVYEVAKVFHVDQMDVWDMLKTFERSVAKKRGLL